MHTIKVPLEDGAVAEVDQDGWEQRDIKVQCVHLSMPTLMSFMSYNYTFLFRLLSLLSVLFDFEDNAVLSGPTLLLESVIAAS